MISQLQEIRDLYARCSESLQIPNEYYDSLWEDEVDVGEELKVKNNAFWNLFFLAYMPLCKLEEACNIFAKEDVIADNQVLYSASEIFDIANVQPITVQERIVHDISADNAYLYDSLWTSLSENDKEKFVSILHDNNCHIDKASKLCYLQDLGRRNLEQDINDLQPEELDILPNIFSSYVSNHLTKLQIDDDAEVQPLKNFLEVFDELIVVSASDSFDEVQYISSIDRASNAIIPLIKYLYSSLRPLFEPDTPNDRFWKIFETIISRPEVAEYFKAWEEEYKDKQVEAVVSSDEERPTQLFEEEHQGAQPTLKDTILSHLSNDTIETDKSLVIGDLRFSVKEKDNLAELFFGLVDTDVVPREDCQYVVYRFTGKWKPNELPERIKWKSDLNDLLYLVKCLIDGNGKYQRALQFFEIDEVPPKQLPSYAERPSANLRAIFKSIYGRG